MTLTQIARLRTLMDDIERTQEPNRKAELRTYVLAYLRASIDGIAVIASAVPLPPEVAVSNIFKRTPPRNAGALRQA